MKRQADGPLPYSVTFTAGGVPTVCRDGVPIDALEIMELLNATHNIYPFKKEPRMNSSTVDKVRIYNTAKGMPTPPTQPTVSNKETRANIIRALGTQLCELCAALGVQIVLVTLDRGRYTFEVEPKADADKVALTDTAYAMGKFDFTLATCGIGLGLPMNDIADAVLGSLMMGCEPNIADVLTWNYDLDTAPQDGQVFEVWLHANNLRAQAQCDNGYRFNYAGRPGHAYRREEVKAWRANQEPSAPVPQDDWNHDLNTMPFHLGVPFRVSLINGAEHTVFAENYSGNRDDWQLVDLLTMKKIHSQQVKSWQPLTPPPAPPQPDHWHSDLNDAPHDGKTFEIITNAGVQLPVFFEIKYGVGKYELFTFPTRFPIAADEVKAWRAIG